MLNEQLGSVSETDQRTIPLCEPYRSVVLTKKNNESIPTLRPRPPTSCADTGTQCYIEEEVSTEDGEEREERERLLEDKNPLSDCSTWNTELPNIGNTVWPHTSYTS